MNKYGLRQEQLKRIILETMNSNPDLKYYVEDDYVLQLMYLMAEGVACAIEENTEHVIDRVTRELKNDL
jgi:hypothetical protein